jgi:fructose-1,6-bisphosphatase-3
LVSSKYTRSKVRKALPNDFSYIIEELLNNDCSDPNKIKYYKNIIDTIIDIDRADAFILALCTTIKKLVVDHLHIVGDVFDRGPRPDIIMDALVNHHSLDIQWGNHDVLWMGAAAGSFACIASVLNNSITYNNLDVIEIGYGISLRPLATFANEIYKDSDVSLYKPTIIEGQKNFDPEDINLCARMRKAILMIAFKLEGQIIKRNPDFKMDDRLLLNRIDFDMNTININGKNYKLKECDFKTIDKDDPYNLTKEEYQLMKRLRSSFINSEKLQRHIKFLYTHGSVYNCYNGNLLFHGCVPFNDDGTLMEFTIKGNTLTGKDFMDYSDSIARQGYYAKPKSKEKIFGEDFLWFLWCGKNSPLFGRNKIATFERLFIEDKDTWVESKNAYYKHYLREETCIDILNMFGLHEDHSHIINGHVPVETKKGENPIKANGKLIVIDGGFCKAYQNATGIAGYTLIYSSYGMRLCSHEPFDGQANAIKNNTDILSDSVVFEHATKRIQVSETDIGKRIKLKIIDLRNLLKAYVSGVFNEHI